MPVDAVRDDLVGVDGVDCVDCPCVGGMPGVWEPDGLGVACNW